MCMYVCIPLRGCCRHIPLPDPAYAQACTVSLLWNCWHYLSHAVNGFLFRSRSMHAGQVDSNSECTYLAMLAHQATYVHVPGAIGEHACLSFSVLLVATVFMHWGSFARTQLSTTLSALCGGAHVCGEAACLIGR